jgi:hypothetical protein
MNASSSDCRSVVGISAKIALPGKQSNTRRMRTYRARPSVCVAHFASNVAAQYIRTKTSNAAYYPAMHGTVRLKSAMPLVSVI